MISQSYSKLGLQGALFVIYHVISNVHIYNNTFLSLTSPWHCDFSFLKRRVLMKAQRRDWWRMKNNSNSWIGVRVAFTCFPLMETFWFEKIIFPATTGDPCIIGDHRFCFLKCAPPIDFSICAGRSKALENECGHIDFFSLAEKEFLILPATNASWHHFTTKSRMLLMASIVSLIFLCIPKTNLNKKSF